ncbi:MAG: hypothetical protein M1274_07485 [Actinobacteria bacterium]|nr:hypothetical protein [Actinomycetota bacterium]
MRSAPVWVLYIVFGVLYSCWALRLTQTFAADRRLGYLLVLTDTALLLPLAAWSSGAALKTMVAVLCGAGLAITYLADSGQHLPAVDTGGKRTTHARLSTEGMSRAARVRQADPESDLESVIRIRLRVYAENRARFGLVVLRIVRFPEFVSYYGEDAAQRMMSAIGRRGIRLLGQDSQRFPLSGGRIAFLFDSESAAAGVAGRDADLGWSEPYDIEGLAMSLGRKVCEHLIEGHRVECVVGWASAPVDGLSAVDLLSAAEAGAHSTAAFRRVSGSRVPVRVISTVGSEGARAQQGVSERARTAVG